MSSSATLGSRASASSRTRGSAPARSASPSVSIFEPNRRPTSITPPSLTTPQLAWSAVRKLKMRMRAAANQRAAARLREGVAASPARSSTPSSFAASSAVAGTIGRRCSFLSSRPSFIIMYFIGIGFVS